jgi:thiamine-monophosphate kinase
MALGEIAAGRIIRRGGARPGERIFVTGTIGDAALGLGILRGEIGALDAAAAAYLAGRYRLPQPRVALGPLLIGIATASLDISDGLVADLRHLCEVSDVGATIAAPRVPLSPSARAAIAADPALLARALTGGDDYEILFTAPAAAAADIAALSQRLGVAITDIGETAAAAAERLRVVDAAGRPLALGHEGWTHF